MVIPTGVSNTVKGTKYRQFKMFLNINIISMLFIKLHMYTIGKT